VLDDKPLIQNWCIDPFHLVLSINIMHRIHFVYLPPSAPNFSIFSSPAIKN